MGVLKRKLIHGAMQVSLTKFHSRAKKIFDRENLKSNNQKVVAFVLDSKGRILTEGWNSYTKTHPVQKKAADAKGDVHKCFMHAEIHALTRLSYKQLSKQDTIVVLRMDVKLNLMPGRPCPICQDVIRQFGIQNIIHS
jgi:tRNA(Arg) A34 adenosine deaminase TadA